MISLRSNHARTRRNIPTMGLSSRTILLILYEPFKNNYTNVNYTTHGIGWSPRE